jgi:hypothetical protein
MLLQILVRAEWVRCPWLLAEMKVAAILITFLLEYNPNEPEYNPNEPGYNPNELEYNPNEPEYNPNEPEYNPNEPVVTAVIQNHRRGCRIVSNFCMGS